MSTVGLLLVGTPKIPPPGIPDLAYRFLLFNKEEEPVYFVQSDKNLYLME